MTKSRLIQILAVILVSITSGYLCYIWAEKSFDMRHVTFMMDSAWRFMSGQCPTRDVEIFVTPLSFFILLSGFLVLGASYKSLLMVSSIVAAIGCGCVTQYFLKRTSLIPAILVGGGVLLYVFGPFAMVYYSSVAIILSFFNILFLLDGLETEDITKAKRYILIAGIFCGLSFLAKQNIGGFGILGGCMVLLLHMPSRRFLLHYLLTSLGLPIVVFALMSLPEGANAFDEYVFVMAQGSADRKVGYGWLYYLPFQGSLTYFISYGTLAWIAFKRAGGAPLTARHLILIFTCFVHIGNYITSSFDPISRLSYTPLILVLLWIEFRPSLKFTQKMLALIAIVYLSVFQYKACDDRRTLYGKHNSPIYHEEYEKGFPGLRRSAYTNGIGDTLTYLKNLSPDETVWCDPDSSLLAIELKLPRPHRMIGIFKMHAGYTPEAIGQTIWEDFEKAGLTDWVVLHGAEQFGLLNAQQSGNIFKTNLNKNYIHEEKFGLFDVYKKRK